MNFCQFFSTSTQCSSQLSFSQPLYNAHLHHFSQPVHNALLHFFQPLQNANFHQVSLNQYTMLISTELTHHEAMIFCSKLNLGSLQHKTQQLTVIHTKYTERETEQDF